MEQTKTKAPGITIFLNIFAVILLTSSFLAMFTTFESFNPLNSDLIFESLVYCFAGIGLSFLFFAIAQIIYQLQILIDKK